MASKWRLLTAHYLTKSPLLYRIRHHSDSGGLVMQTTLSRVNVEDAAPLISGYSMLGFSLRGAHVIGSVALLPRGFFHWKINSPDDITPESMSIFTLIEPKLGLILLILLSLLLLLLLLLLLFMFTIIIIIIIIIIVYCLLFIVYCLLFTIIFKQS